MGFIVSHPFIFHTPLIAISHSGCADTTTRLTCQAYFPISTMQRALPPEVILWNPLRVGNVRHLVAQMRLAKPQTIRQFTAINVCKRLHCWSIAERANAIVLCCDSSNETHCSPGRLPSQVMKPFTVVRHPSPPPHHAQCIHPFVCVSLPPVDSLQQLTGEN